MSRSAHHEGTGAYRRGIGSANWQRRLACLSVALGCILPAFVEANAQSGRFSAPEIEAAYLFNFGKFVRWPQRASTVGSSFSVCVMGDDPFGGALHKTVAGETIDDKKVVDKHISQPQEAANCSILYISTAEAGQLNKTLAVVKDLPVLTVSDMPDFMERGGIIEFVVQGNRVRFAVNLEPTQRNGLMLSSELLKVALEVKRGSERGSR